MQEAVILAPLKTRQQGIQGGAHIPHQPHFHMGAAAQPFAVGENLGNAGIGLQEILPGEIGAQQQNNIGLGNGIGTGLAANKAGHADTIGIVMFQRHFPLKRPAYRRIKATAQFTHLFARILAAHATINEGAFGTTQHFHQLIKRAIIGAQHCARAINRGCNGGFG